MKAPPWSLLLRDPGHLLSLGFGSGLAPLAPGTAGTLVAVPLAALLAWAGWPWHLGAAVLACVIGVRLCERTAQALGSHDPSPVVWDEIAGFFVATIGLPPNLRNLAAAFVLFRLLDAIKPWPISLADRRLGGGLGIMADDILAGLVTLAALHALRSWGPAGWL